MVRILTTLAGALLVSTLHAESATTVLIDRGGLSIQEVLNENDKDKPTIEDITAPKPPPKDKGLLSEAMYPVVSENLQVGPVGPDEATDIPAYLLTSPIFIVGYDKVSLNWMLDNLDYLEDQRAIGLVVNIRSAEQMEHLIKETQGRLPLTPMSADRMAREIGLRHYPVFMNSQGVVR